MKIETREIGPGHAPFIIAEMSANHHGTLNNALQIRDSAKRAGADAVKLQTYRPDTITLDSDAEEFMIRGGLWDGKTLYQLYQEAHTPWEWHAALFEHARKEGILIFSSPFDRTAVDLLEKLNCPAYKIASFEMIDLPLIKYAASTGKPMILSTGMASGAEIEEALEAARAGGCKELALLRCVSGYPAPPSDYNLTTIPDMMRRFGVVVGLSDHTLGNATAIAAVALGACIIEKHFTLDRKAGGPDDSFSLEPAELASLCEDAKTAWQATGRVDYGCKSSDQGNIKYRRSLYFVKALKAGDVITADSVKSVRPGYGLAPKLLDQVVGEKVKVDIRINTPVKPESIAWTS